MTRPLDTATLNQLFLEARTFDKFTAEPLDDALLERRYELYRWGPTSVNCQPARVLFLVRPLPKNNSAWH